MVEVDDRKRTTRDNADDAADLLRVLLEICHGDIEAELIAHRQNVQQCVGGAGDRHIEDDGVHQGLLRDQLRRTDVLLHHLNHVLTGFSCLTDLQAVHCRDAGGARKNEVEDLTHELHGVCGTHRRTCTAGRAYTLFHLEELLITLTGEAGNVYVGLNDLTSLMEAGGHASTGYNHRRDIETCRCLVAAGDDIITGSDHTDTVELMYLADCLNRHADDITHHLLVLHLLDTVRDVSTGCRDSELHRDTTRCPDSLLYSLRDLTKVCCSRRTLLERVWYTDMRLGTNVLITVAGSL